MARPAPDPSGRTQTCGATLKDGGRCGHIVGPAGRCAAGHLATPAPAVAPHAQTASAAVADPFADGIAAHPSSAGDPAVRGAAECDRAAASGQPAVADALRNELCAALPDTPAARTRELTRRAGWAARYAEQLAADQGATTVSAAGLRADADRVRDLYEASGRAVMAGATIQVGGRTLEREELAAYDIVVASAHLGFHDAMLARDPAASRRARVEAARGVAVVARLAAERSGSPLDHGDSSRYVASLRGALLGLTVVDASG